jgi:transcription termination factor NusB
MFLNRFLSLLWLLLILTQWVSAYTPSIEFQSKLEATTKTLDIMLEKRWDAYRTRFLALLEIYKWEYKESEKASYVLGYISDNLTTEQQKNCVMYEDFSGSQKNSWIIVNDWVMWGLSKWKYITENNTMIFSGNINTNGGWFTSIRASLTDWALDNMTHIILQAKADFRSYNMTFRDNNRRWITYQTQVRFENPWSFEEIKIPITSFKPTFFGSRINASSFQKDTAREIGFIISDGINGGFEMEIESIEFCEE